MSDRERLVNWIKFYSKLKPPTPKQIKRETERLRKVIEDFDHLFSRANNFKHLLLSFNSKSYPKKEIMLALLKRYFKRVELLERKHNYQITGKENKKTNNEYLFKASR